jgi:type II restriction enzyme
MLAAVRRNLAPNLVIVNYGHNWSIDNLFLVPSLFFIESVLEKRPPLSAQARRAGWIGCNLLIRNVPADGKIALVRNRTVVPAHQVRAVFNKYRKLEALDWTLRGWTLDVLNAARKLGRSEFSLEEIYKYESELALLHPNNRNVRPKIRQQLQVLRDFKILEFVERGRYRLANSNPRAF